MKFLSLCLLVFIVSCTKEKRCETHVLVVNSATAATGSALGCEKPQELKPYIDKAVSALKLCSKVPQGLGSVLCGPAISAVFSAGLSSLPPAAKCAGGAPVDFAKAAAIAACEAIIP